MFQIQSRSRIQTTIVVLFSLFALSVFAVSYSATRSQGIVELTPPLIQPVAVLVTGIENRENVLVPSLKSIQTHVVQPVSRAGFHVHVTFCFAPSDASRRRLAQFVKVEEYFDIQCDNMFQRADECFQRLMLSYRTPFSFIIKTRPDSIWLQNVCLPFKSDAIMVRARRVSGAFVNSLHLSSPFSCGCDDDKDCLMVDDQVAVVPLKWQRAYFQLDSLNLTDKVSSSTVRAAEKDRALHWADGREIQLTPNWLDKCPCSSYWNEGLLTMRLAAHSVLTSISPFNFVLAPPTQNGSYWRQAGEAVHDGQDWRWC